MVSTLDNRQHDPHDLLEISPDVVLVARQAADFPTLAPNAMGREPYMGAADEAAVPKLDTTFRASDTSGARSSHGKWMRRAATVFAFAFVSVFATAAWERYGDEAQAMLANNLPQLSLASLLPTSLFSGQPAVAAQPNETAAPQPSVAADRPAQQPASADSVAASAQDTAQLLQSMARDVASLNQQISELKASLAAIKASQEQLSHDAVKPSEARVSEAKPVEPRATPAPAKLGAPPRPLGTLVTPVHRPKPPTYPPAQAAYVPPPPASAPVQIAPQATTEPDGSVVVRPPMPVR